MPSKNSRKIYVPATYYHVYNRGVEKREIFLDDTDYSVFLNLFKRYLSVSPKKDVRGRQYQHLRGQVELLAYCLMPNHFHILVYVSDNPEYLPKLIQMVVNAYVDYFNRKYQRLGPLFQGRYKASIIDSDEYLLHISRYIHRNPEDYLDWKPSSLKYYLGTQKAEWLHSNRIMSLFESRTDYLRFLTDYSLKGERSNLLPKS